MTPAALVLAASLLLQPMADSLGDPLPEGAIQRLGTLRLRYAGGVVDHWYLDGDTALVVLPDATEVWDMALGEMVDRVELPFTVRAADLSPDQSRLLLASRMDLIDWDRADREVMARWDTAQAGIVTAAYSPDGMRALSVGGNPPTLKQWDLITGEELLSADSDIAQYTDAVYGADGLTAWIGGGHEWVIEEWDLEAGERRRAIHRDYITYNLTLRPDGERLLVGSRHHASEWDTSSAKRLQAYSGHHGHAVPSVAYCGDYSELLTGSRDGSIRRWNADSGELLFRWFPLQSHVTRMRVSPGGLWVMAYGGGKLVETSPEDGQARIQWPRHEGEVTDVAVLPGGRVASASTDGSIRIWDPVSGGCLDVRWPVTDPPMEIHGIAVSADGRRLAAACKDARVRELDLMTGTLRRTLAGHRGFVRDVTYVGRSGRLVSAADDGSVVLWGRDGDEPLARLEGHLGGVLSLACSSDGRRALSGGRDGTVRLWDLAAGMALDVYRGHRGWVEAVGFDGEGGILAAGRDGRLLHWDSAAPEQPRAEYALGGWARALAIDEGRSVAYAVDESRDLMGIDLHTGETTVSRSGHSMAMTALALDTQRGRAITGSADTSLLVWDLER
ncbi:MAG: hypothetical protein GF320_02270 [Armatimonadia bacterium]|nr:hypothetical protein [Armatimonadia bacterium]